MRVAFRVDASTLIGSGHVMRCLSLAETLRDSGAEVLFVSRRHPGNLCDVVNRRGIEVRVLPEASSGGPGGNSGGDGATEPAHASWLGVRWELDAEQTLAALGSDASWDWLVVDHYGIDKQWEQKLRPAARRILAIDDLDDRPHEVDVLIDQGYHGRSCERYVSHTSRSTTLLLGPRYALLRKDFLEKRLTLKEKTGALERMIVYFGAADGTGQTMKSLRALRRAAIPGLRIDVILGGDVSERTDIEESCRWIPGVNLHNGVDDMASMLAEADLAIGAAGTTTWERCCLGLPTLLIDIASNQQQIAEKLGDDGYCIHLGSASDVTEDQIADTVRALAANPRLMRSIGRRARSLVDGLGARRVVSRMVSDAITLRRATLEDGVALLAWRNAPENRRFALDPGLLEPGRHMLWLKSVLADRNCVLLIGTKEGEPIGVLRYDVTGKEGRVSIYLVPGRHGTGLGPQLLEAGTKWILQHREDVDMLVAEIRPENHRSVRAFEIAGYVADTNIYRRRLRN